MITLIANFNINSRERYLRMIDSYDSIKDLCFSEYVINIRGSYKHIASEFLQHKLELKKFDIHHLESSKGWLHDTLQISRHVTTPLIFVWIEDHIYMNSPEFFRGVVNDMLHHNIDYLEYSWFGGGLLASSFSTLPTSSTHYISYLDYGVEEAMTRNNFYLENFNDGVYIISLVSIVGLKLFHRLLSERVPLFLRWPKYTPFNFEKRWDDIYWLPFRLAIPNQELFAPIDDDNHFKGNCLIARGIYPCRVSRNELLKYRSPAPIRVAKTFLKSNNLIFTISRKVYHLFRSLPYQL